MMKVTLLRYRAEMFITGLMLVVASFVALAQQLSPVAIYRERGYPFGVVTTPTMFGGTGSVLFEVVQRGLYVTDTISWHARQIPEVTGMGSYEYSIFVRRSLGGVACLQQGNAGTRLWKFDESLNVWSDTLPERIDTLNVFGGSKPYIDNAMWLPISATSTSQGIAKVYVTFDGCDSWVDVKNYAGPILNDGIGGFWIKPPASNHYSILHPLTNVFARGESVQTPIKYKQNGYSNPSFHKAFYGSDTIIWIQSVNHRISNLGIGALGDTVATFLAPTFTTADGRTVKVVGEYCHLFNTQTRRVFLRDSALTIYEYKAGQWHTVDTAKHLRWRYGSPTYSAEYAYYPAIFDGGTTGFTILHLADSLEQELRVKDYYDADNNVRFYPSVHPDMIHTTLNFNGSAVLTLRSGRGYMLSSTLRDIEDLEPTPMLLGIGGTGGERPLVVSYYGHMVRPEESGAGQLISATTNGESIPLDRAFKPVPKWLTTRGLLAPAVSSTDILFPGTVLRQFDRPGRFLGIVDQEPSTCALRLSAESILIGNSTTVRRWQSGVMADSTDVRQKLVASDTIGSGFMSAMMSVGDTAVVGFVSGLHIYDSESLEVHPYLCGGIVRSTDKGQSWQAVPVPDQDPYFLGTVTADNSVLIASYTTMVRDTAKMRQEESRLRDHEPLFTTMQDCHIIRSSDGGRTWQKVYSRSANFGFRFVGGSGIRLKDGRLLINGIDGVLESLDNGLTWDFHDAGFTEPTQVISLFTDDDGRDIYYCTTTGVFKSESLTSVDEARELRAARGAHQARTWHQHKQAWTAIDSQCTALTNLMGERMLMAPAEEPAPGLYVAEIIDGRGAVARVPILVVGL